MSDTTELKEKIKHLEELKEQLSKQKTQQNIHEAIGFFFEIVKDNTIAHTITHINQDLILRNQYLILKNQNLILKKLGVRHTIIEDEYLDKNILLYEEHHNKAISLLEKYNSNKMDRLLEDKSEEKEIIVDLSKGLREGK